MEQLWRKALQSNIARIPDYPNGAQIVREWECAECIPGSFSNLTVKEPQHDIAHTYSGQKRKPFDQQAYLSRDFSAYLCAIHCNQRNFGGFMAFRSVSPNSNPYRPLKCSIPQCSEGKCG